MQLRDLISAEYQAANRALHDAPEGFGGSGHKHAANVMAFMHDVRPKEMLDYGCGEGTLRDELIKRGVTIPIHEYDPAIPAKSRVMPKPAGLVVCTDVLEHVEPEKLKAVLSHLCELTIKGAYLVIATRPANKHMPDGTNAHRIIEDTWFWLKVVGAMPWRITLVDDVRKGNGTGHEVRLWIQK